MSSVSGGKKFKTKEFIAWIAWGGAVLFYLYEYLARVAPSVMEEELLISFDASIAQIATALGIYYFIYSPMQIIVGAVLDKFGVKRIIILASILVSVGCLLCPIRSSGLLPLSAGRFLMGVGSSFGFTGVMCIAAMFFRSNRLALVAGLTTSLGIIGGLVGQAPLSLLVDSVGWRMAWMCIAFFGFGVTICLALFIPNEAKNQKNDDSEFLDKKFLSGLKSVLRNKQTWYIGFVGACLYMPLIVFGDLWGIQYVRTVTGASKVSASLVVGMLYIGWLVGSPVVGAISDYLGRRKRILLGGSLLCTVLLSVLLLFRIESTVVMGSILFLIGVISSPEVVCFAASLEINHKSASGSAVAVVNMIVMIVGSIFQPFVGWFIDRFNTVEYGVTSVDPNVFRAALLSMPFMTFLGFLMCFLLKEKKDAN